MPNKTGFKHNRQAFRNENSPFFLKWGEHAIDIAQRENIAVASIHQRVHLFGTPYQRRAEPSITEELCGKTIWVLSQELNVHPVSIQQRIFKHNNPYISDMYTKKPVATHCCKPRRAYLWLAPEHPCHDEWLSERLLQNEKLKLEAGYTGEANE